MSKTRGNGEGSISQRDDRRYMARITLPNGARKAFYGKTRAEAATKLAAALADAQRGVVPIDGRTTVQQFLDRWLKESVELTVRPKTSLSYGQLVTWYIVPAIGRQRLASLTPAHVQAMLRALSAEGKSPRTVQYVRAVLRRALNQALKWGLVARNVATLVDPPRSVHVEIEPLTPEQAVQFLDAVRDDRLSALYIVALTLGLRQGEALGLVWSDVDLERRTLSVRYALQRIGPGWERVEPKTKQSRRTLPLPEVTLAALHQHRAQQLQDRLLAGERWREHGFVFASTIGTPLDGHNVTRRFQKLLEEAKLPRRRFHDLRHSCATFLLAQGVSDRIVMEILGHSQISLTARYQHVLPEVTRSALGTMDTLLGRRAATVPKGV